MKVLFRPEKKHAILLQDTFVSGVWIGEGFKWDGASIPLFVVSLLMLNPFHPKVRRASLYHDWAYQNKRDRKSADKDFAKLCRESGCNWLQCQIMYVSVRAFGWIAYNRIKKETQNAGKS